MARTPGEILAQELKAEDPAEKAKLSREFIDSAEKYFADIGLKVTVTHTIKETHNHVCMVGGVSYPCPAPVDGSQVIVEGLSLECSPEMADYPTDDCPLCHDSDYPLLAHLSPEDIDLLIGVYRSIQAELLVSATFEEMQRLQEHGYIKELVELDAEDRGSGFQYEFYEELKLEETFNQYRELKEEGDLEAFFETLRSRPSILVDPVVSAPDHSYNTGGVLDGLGLRPEDNHE